MQLKQCPDCGETKLVTEFRGNRARPDGLSFYCKPCFKKRDSDLYKQRRVRAGFKLRATPDVPRGHKYCPGCELVLARTTFHSNVSQASGLTTYCKKCTSVRKEEEHLRRTYGITLAEKRAMVERQGGVCVICGAENPQHVDHDHVTGEVRGVICFNCNGGLGQFKDKPALLMKATKYLMGARWRQGAASETAMRIVLEDYRHRASTNS